MIGAFTNIVVDTSQAFRWQMVDPVLGYMVGDNLRKNGPFCTPNAL